MELADASCSAKERPFRFAYHIENPPTRLLEADPAPSLTTSDNSRGSMLSPRAFDAARPKAASKVERRIRALASNMILSDSGGPAKIISDHLF